MRRRSNEEFESDADWQIASEEEDAEEDAEWDVRNFEIANQFIGTDAVPASTLESDKNRARTCPFQKSHHCEH